MQTRKFTLAIVLAFAGIARAGDYYLYKDLTGSVWLSNQDPRNKDESAGRRPDDLTIMKQYQWQDVTDERLAASAAADRQLVAINALRDIAAANERLSNEIALERAARPAQSDVASEATIIVDMPRPFRVHSPQNNGRPRVTKRHGSGYFMHPLEKSTGR